VFAGFFWILLDLGNKAEAFEFGERRQIKSRPFGSLSSKNNGEQVCSSEESSKASEAWLRFVVIGDP